MDPTARRTPITISESPDDAEPGWSRFGAFPVMVAAIVGLLWRAWRERRGGGRRVVPDVPHPRALRDARLR